MKDKPLPFWQCYKEHREIVNYLIVGGLTTIVSLSVYYLSVLFFLDPKDALELQIANLISWICAVLFAYVTNRVFVFHSENENKLRECIGFFLSRAATLFMDAGSMFLLVTMIGMNDKIAKLIVQVIVTIGNYILSKYFVFKKR